MHNSNKKKLFSQQQSAKDAWQNTRLSSANKRWEINKSEANRTPWIVLTDSVACIKVEKMSVHRINK